MASKHRVVRVHGGRLVNGGPRVELAAQLDAASGDGFELVDTFTVDDNLYLVLRREVGSEACSSEPETPRPPGISWAGDPDT